MGQHGHRRAHDSPFDSILPPRSSAAFSSARIGRSPRGADTSMPAIRQFRAGRSADSTAIQRHVHHVSADGLERARPQPRDQVPRPLLQQLFSRSFL